MDKMRLILRSNSRNKDLVVVGRCGEIGESLGSFIT
jgi:hypothetical protein